MDTLLEVVGLTMAEFTQLAILAVVLVVGLVLARAVFRLTAALFRVGCFAVLFIVAVVFIFNAVY